MAFSSVPKALVHLRGEAFRRSIVSDVEQTYLDTHYSSPAVDENKSTYLPRQLNSKILGDDTWEDIEHRNEVTCPSFTSSLTTLAMDEQEVQLPSQRYRYEWMNKWRWQDCLIYHRLNALIVTVNAVFIVTYSVLAGALWTLPIDLISTAMTANIFLTVLTRNELLVNLLFWLFGCLSPNLPLRLRRMAAKVYHYGGSHSGSAFSAALWLLVFNINLICSTWVASDVAANRAILATTMAVDLIMLTVIGTSMPSFRRSYHNTWECTHRYGGWTLLVLFWAQLGITTNVSTKGSRQSMAWIGLLAHSPSFWMLLLITICIIWPWLRLRKVKVRAHILSDHAVQLHFEYTNIAFCVAPRLSDNPWREWHSFAAIPHPDGYGYSVLVSKSGDWTSKIIKNPPESLWIRSIPVRGVLHLAPIFKSMVLVATGSGIGPVLSLLFARRVKCRILWSTRDPLRTFQEEVYNQVKHADPEAVIIDTTAMGGRPNLVEEAYKLYCELDAEAVFVISNPGLSIEMVYNLESRGVPCFAPIFDS